ncbi:MAG: sulfotransferase, partial [Bacteroidota bacterium]
MSPLPLKFRLINSIGSGLSKVGINLVSFDVDKLMQKAAKKTRISDYGDEAFKEGLTVLVKSIESSDIDTVNKFALRNTIQFNLTRRLILENTKRKRPDIFQQELNDPLIVLGFPRTGTTILHRLLALDPAARAYSMLELKYPFPWMNLDALRPQMQKGYDLM